MTKEATLDPTLEKPMTDNANNLVVSISSDAAEGTMYSRGLVGKMIKEMELAEEADLIIARLVADGVLEPVVED